MTTLNRAPFSFSLFLLVAFALPSGCGDDGRPSTPTPGSDSGTMMDAGMPSSCGAPGRTGMSPCETSMTGSCGPGQYCDNERLTCSPGCTSDNDCGPTDLCVRAGGAAVGACQRCSMCGDSVCQPDETPATCPADCSAPNPCGDGTCGPGETTASCPADCSEEPRCGDGVCQSTENEASCPGDCSTSSLDRCIDTCRRTSTCGAPAGDVDSCRAECGVAPMAQQDAFAACASDDCVRMASCMGLECFGSDQCSAGTCINATCCGNGVCDPDFESEATCPADCARDFLAECYEECEGFAFFGCGTGCREACTASDPASRVRFVECGNPPACNFDDCVGEL